MSTTYLFNGLVLIQRMNADWSVTTYTQNTGPVEIDPPGTRTSFTMEEWGVELADINGGSFSYSTFAYGPVTDYMGDANPVSIQVLNHAGGTTTLLKIDRHVRLGDGTLIGFDTVLVPISGAALPSFPSADDFAAWYFALPWNDPTETYPVGTEFLWEDFDIDSEPLDGTAGADTLVGTNSDDTINGLDGNDLLRGGRGDDLISGDAGNDTLEGGEGRDTLNGGSGNDILRGGLGMETDMIDGGSGIDTVDYADLAMGFMAGGLTVNLATGRTSGTPYIGLDQLVSIENANGTGGSDTLIGSDDGNVLRGLAGNDRLVGNGGNDTLEGGGGNDTLIGGTGDDRYITDGLDTIAELSGGGIDTVLSSASITLAAHVEHLVLTGTTNLTGHGNTLANQITGNAGANRLTGGAGNDTLSGNAGADRLEGGEGNDVLQGGAGSDTLIGGTGDDRYVTDGLDTIVEFSGGGIDTVLSSASITLAAHVEHLGLTGAANLAGHGNTLANRITGNAGANRLTGGAGNDTLSGNAGADRLEGGAGNDVLTGGSGADAFVFNTALSATLNVDRITDFDSTDRILLETGIFRAIGSVLAAAEFKVIASGTSFASVDASDRLIYQQATGRLFYDADGSGSAARVLFAQLTANTILALDDFLMI